MEICIYPDIICVPVKKKEVQIDHKPHTIERSYMDKKVLEKFILKESDLTKQGDKPAELVSIEKKFDFDSERRVYTDKVVGIVAVTFFPAFLREKLAIKLPAGCISDREIESWTSRLADDEIILVRFQDLKIGLVQAKDQIMIKTSATGIEEILEI